VLDVGFNSRFSHPASRNFIQTFAFNWDTGKVEGLKKDSSMRPELRTKKLASMITNFSDAELYAILISLMMGVVWCEWYFKRF